MQTLFADLRQNGSNVGRSRLLVEPVTGPWCTTTIPSATSTASAISAAAIAGDRLMAKRTFARKYHAQRPEETPNG